MKQYYIIHNDQQLGPFPPEELINRHVAPDTPVWCDGMSDWAPAREVPDLNFLWNSVSSNISHGISENSSLVPPKNYLVWSILVTLLCCQILGIVAIIYSAQVNSKFQAKDYAGAQRASDKAKQFCIIGAISGFIIGILYAIVMFIGGID